MTTKPTLQEMLKEIVITHWNKVFKHQSEESWKAASARESSSSWILHIAFILFFLSARTDDPKCEKGVQRDSKYLEAGLHFPLRVGMQGVSHGIKEKWDVWASNRQVQKGGIEGHILS